MACFNSTVPLTGVYLVKFSSSARMAVRLMLSGVGKSGSPALKSTTSTPSRRSRSASAATFIVEDSLMSEMRCASSCTVCIILNSVLREAAFQPLFDACGHHAGDIAAQRNHLLDQVRADERIRL